jgi:flavin reductase
MSRLLHYDLGVNTSEFKDFMAAVPTCVAIVATPIKFGIQACTISSVTSFDIQSPGIMIVLQKKSRTLRSIKKSEVFSVNILNTHQVPLAEQFSSKAKELDSDGIAHFSLNTEFLMPYLIDCPSVAFCKVETAVDFENASVIFGRVIGLSRSDRKSPLIYSERKYFTLGYSLT